MKQTCGLLMIVRNEEKRLKDCLNWHLPYVDEVAICDQESTDSTLSILEGFKSISQIPFKIYHDKNWGYCEPSKQVTASLLNTDWILYLDPDEKFPRIFLEKIHTVIETEEYDGFLFPRYNFFQVQIFDDNVPINPKWLTIQHPAKDPQLRLTRKSVSVFPEYLHHRVRIINKRGEKRMYQLPYPIEHLKTIKDQWEDQRRYKVINNKNV